MSRATAFRFNRPDTVFVQQEAALEGTMYIVRELGPTCFVIQEQEQGVEEAAKPKGHKVTLGDPHTCTCAYFKKERDLCKHIIWLLLRRFRIDRGDQIGWQLGLVQREIDELISGVERRRVLAKRQEQQLQQQQQQQNSENENRLGSTGKQKGVQQRPVNEEDVCPICQEELLGRRLPICYCSQTCGNNVHLKCMKVWADHQRTNQQGTLSTDENLNLVPCPMCRGTFCTYASLKQQFHNAESGSRVSRPSVQTVSVSVQCSNCRKQIAQTETHYRCAVCAQSSNASAEYLLCKQCFNQPVHFQHDRFEYRQKANGKWKEMRESRSACMLVCGLPNAVASQLMNRDLSENDYDLLLQLDQNATTDSSVQIPERVIEHFRVQQIKENSKLLLPGIQCLICLKGYKVGEQIKILPKCSHKFHAACLTNWLLHHRSTCPIDGTLVWSRDDDVLQRPAPSAAARPSAVADRHTQHAPVTSLLSVSRKPISSVNRNNSAMSDLSVSGSRMAASASRIIPETATFGPARAAGPLSNQLSFAVATAVERTQTQLFVGAKPVPVQHAQKPEEQPRSRVRPPKPLYRTPLRDNSAAARQLPSEVTNLSIAGSSNADIQTVAAVGQTQVIRQPVPSILHRLSSIANS